jgi:CspA family cold shock protein
MKHFGTVKSFDVTAGSGAITPETGGADLRFERSAFSWASGAPPKVGQRLSYDLAHTNGEPSAINLTSL